MGVSEIPNMVLDLDDYEEGKKRFQVPCIITSMIIREYKNGQAAEYFDPYWYWNDSSHSSHPTYLPFSVSIMSGDQNAKICYSSKLCGSNTSQSNLETIWNTQPIYATHTVSAGGDRVLFLRQHGISLYQMLPDIVVLEVSEPTSIKVGFGVFGVYAEAGVTVYPADKSGNNNCAISFRNNYWNLYGIYPNEHKNTVS